MISRSIKLAILEVAHLIWQLCNQITFILILVYYNLLFAVEQANKSCDQINESNVHTKGIRIPKHIALSFTNELRHLDLEAIARLVCWCKQLGIESITLYDDQGSLKCIQQQIVDHIELKLRLLGYDKPIKQIDGLNIISNVDGRRKFVQDVRSLVKKSQESITESMIQDQIGWRTDPELLLSFGSPQCLYGFPPWQLRLTEIVSVRTHRSIPQKVFLNCLRRYSKTIQRLGV